MRYPPSTACIHVGIPRRRYSEALVSCKSYPCANFMYMYVLFALHIQCIQQNLSWKTTPLATQMWSLKTGGLWWQVQLQWNVDPFTRNIWSFKTGGLSQQRSLKTGFTVCIFQEEVFSGSSVASALSRQPINPQILVDTACLVANLATTQNTQVDYVWWGLGVCWYIGFLYPIDIFCRLRSWNILKIYSWMC